MVVAQLERLPSSLFLSRAFGCSDASPRLESRGDTGCCGSAPPPRYTRVASPDSAAFALADGLFAHDGAAGEAWLNSAFGSLPELETVRPRASLRAAAAGRRDEVPACWGATRARARCRVRAAPHHVWHTKLDRTLLAGERRRRQQRGRRAVALPRRGALQRPRAAQTLARAPAAVALPRRITDGPLARSWDGRRRRAAAQRRPQASPPRAHSPARCVVLCGASRGRRRTLPLRFVSSFSP